MQYQQANQYTQKFDCIITISYTYFLQICFVRIQSTMHSISFLFVICVAIGYVNGAFESPYGIDCRCTCCFPSKTGDCSPVDIGSVHLKQTVCNQTLCFNGCDKTYFNCRGWGGNLTTTCSDS